MYWAQVGHFFKTILCFVALVCNWCFFQEQPFYGNYSTLDSLTNTVIFHTFAYSSRLRRKPWQGLFVRFLFQFLFTFQSGHHYISHPGLNFAIGSHFFLNWTCNSFHELSVKWWNLLLLDPPAAWYNFLGIGVSKYSCSSFQPLKNMRDNKQTLKKKIDFLAARLSGIINERLV